ncbi:MAG TPA: hypothetical protein PK252_13380 [Bacteroidales bacterium]|nr:hypothetical protein [Bacteroidales bacterium]
MKRNFLKISLLALSSVALLLTSCEKSEDTPDITANNLKGMFVVCEGNFGSANGDITFYNSDPAKTVKNLYNSANGLPVGDVVQAFEIVDTLGFIVVNNSQKVTVVNMRNFKVIKNIGGFSYPRNVVRANENTVYISNGKGKNYENNYIYSIDLKTLTKSDSLDVETGPEKLIVVNSKVYAAIAGGWDNDGNTVIEIDPSTFKITNTFEVASVPIDLVTDKDNNIWAYCKGVADKNNYSPLTYTNSGISKINLSTKVVNNFPLKTMYASEVNCIAANKDGSIIYYLNDGLYAMAITATELPTAKLVDHMFFGMDVDPKTGNIICLDDANSMAIGYNAKGEKLFSFGTASFPNSVVFSY